MSRQGADRGKGLFVAGITACLLVLFLTSAGAGYAREPFEAYSEEVRLQAARVVAAAGPAKEQDLPREVDLLRKKMLARGVLSMNEIPDRIYERALKERWTKDAAKSVRAVTPVSALSVPMWAWLIKEDILGLNIGSFVDDAQDLAATLRWFGPALMGYAAWAISYLSAAACWYVVWISLSLFLRARPSLEFDIFRAVRIPRREYAAPVLALLVFILPMAAGAGLAVTACLWLLLATAYLRRAEILLVIPSLLLLVGVIVAGGAVDSLTEMAGNTGTGRWLAGEGYAVAPSRAVPTRAVASSEMPAPWMISFAKARMETEAGNPQGAERIWSELLSDGKDLPEIYNNRGIALAQQGKTQAALADFESAIGKRADDGPALWNAYQVHLQTFSLELASAIQPQAWEAVGRMAPFRFRPPEMDQGEWIASALPVSEIWKGYVEKKEEWIRAAEGNGFLELFFRPHTVTSALIFLALSLVAAGLIKALTLKFWLSCTCRACGGHLLIAGSKEASDLCTPCRGQIGDGLRGGEERERRLQTIRLHGRYVKACSIVVPGAGAFWAGKEIRAAAYGIWLSLALAAVTMALGGVRAGEALITSLQGLLLWIAIVVTGVLWIAGSAWSFWSFNRLQQHCSVPMAKR